MGQKERNALDELLRNSPLDLGGEVRERRRILKQMLGAGPLAADMTTATRSGSSISPTSSARCPASA